MSASSRVLDPVCGMLIEPAQAAGVREHRGATWYLCSDGCLVKFDADADAYIAATRVDAYRVWMTDEFPGMGTARDA
jgi:YHS domain-containing protein